MKNRNRLDLRFPIGKRPSGYAGGNAMMAILQNGYF
jgi:hypothetical protein